MEGTRYHVVTADEQGNTLNTDRFPGTHEETAWLCYYATPGPKVRIYQVTGEGADIAFKRLQERRGI